MTFYLPLWYWRYSIAFAHSRSVYVRCEAVPASFSTNILPKQHFNRINGYMSSLGWHNYRHTTDAPLLHA